jgi:hypothetical protein
MDTLRDEIAAIIEKIAEGDTDYWNGYELFGILDEDAVVADIMAAVVEHDGEVVEVFGGG